MARDKIYSKTMKNTKRIKVRRDWGTLNPITRVKQSKKGYSRKNFKIEVD